MQTREQVIKVVREYLSGSGMSPRQFGLDVVGDSKFVSRLESGAGVTLTTIEKVEAFILKHPLPAPERREPHGAAAE